MDNQLKEKKINDFIESMKGDDSIRDMSAQDLLKKIEDADVLTKDELEQLRTVEQVSNKENATFKSSVLSNLVYTRYDDVVEYINEQKLQGKTPTLDDIVDSGKLTSETSPLDVASLAYYAKTFTPVNVIPEGQFSFNNYKSLDESNKMGANRKMTVSYKNGVYRADDNLAMAMTVMSVGADGKPEMNVSFRGTDVDSKNKMVEPDGTIAERGNGMFGRYIPETYLDMAGHKVRAFEPLVSAITDIVNKTENNQFNNAGYDISDIAARKNSKIPVVATGHSLGGGMVEEWTKSNSSLGSLGYENSVRNAFASSGALGTQSAYATLREGFKRNLNSENPGALYLKAITFGAPSNSRNSFGLGVSGLTRSIKRSVVEFNTLGQAITGAELQRENSIEGVPELKEKIISIQKYEGMMNGEFGGNMNRFRKEVGADEFKDLGQFDSSVQDGLNDSKFLKAYREYRKEMDDGILKRDLEVYCTPNDPVAKHLIKTSFSRVPGNFNIVDPIAQKDETFSIATEGIKDRYSKDGIKDPNAPEEVKEKMTFKGALKKLAVTALIVLANTANYLSFKNLGKAIEGIKDRNANIEYHSMKAYVGTSMIKGSPLRGDENVSEMSGLDKLAFLVEMKAKKDIVAMEVITKEAGIENVVRDYAKSVKSGGKEVFSYSDFKRKGNAWENTPGADELTRQMTAKFKDIKDTFGGAITLSSKEMLSVSPDVTTEISKTVQEKFDNGNLPKRFEEYKGRGVEQVSKDALNFVHEKVSFQEAVADFAISIKETDLSKISAKERESNPLLKPKENHILQVAGDSFNKPQQHSFGTKDGLDTVMIMSGNEPIIIRRNSPGSNTWEDATKPKANNDFKMNGIEIKLEQKGEPNNLLNPTLSIDTSAIKMNRYMPEDLGKTSGVKMRTVLK